MKRPNASALNLGDRMFTWFLRALAMLIILVFAYLFWTLASYSSDVIRAEKLNYFTGQTWNLTGTEVNPVEFGALPLIYGTVVTSVLALLIVTPFAVGTAIFVSEYAPPWLGGPVAFIVELLVTIPSIVYGLWGFFVLKPYMASDVMPFLRDSFGAVPVLGALFAETHNDPITGLGFLTGSIILAIMILPTILSLSREIIVQVPRLQKEGIMALGATKWEVISKSILPYARSGIAGAMILGLARAIGETMAVTLVIGNKDSISSSLFASGQTLASAIANQFTEADNSNLSFSAVVGLGLILLVVASGFNILSRILVAQATKMPGGPN